MNELLVVQYYKRWFCRKNTTGLLSLQVHALKIIFDHKLRSIRVWCGWSFNYWVAGLVGMVYIPEALQEMLEPMYDSVIINFWIVVIIVML